MSNSLFCFGHKKGKSMVKRTNLKWITFKKSKSLFHKAPVTLYLKMTFPPVAFYKKSDREQIVLLALYLKSNQSESLMCSLIKEQQEWFAPIALFKRATRAKERRTKEWKSKFPTLENRYFLLPKRSPHLVPISLLGKKHFPPPPSFNLGIYTGDWLIDILLNTLYLFNPPSYLSCTNAVPYVSHIF